MHYLDSPRLDASNRSINCQLGATASFDKDTHQGLVTVPPLRLGASVQRANRPQLGACTSVGGTAICTSGSGISTTLAARRLCSDGQPPSARCLHQPGRHSHMHIRVRYQYHPRGSAPLFKGPTALSSVPAPAWAAQPYAHQGLVAVPPLRLGASVQRADRPQLVPIKLLGELLVSDTHSTTNKTNRAQNM